MAWLERPECVCVSFILFAPGKTVFGYDTDYGVIYGQSRWV